MFQRLKVERSGQHSGCRHLRRSSCHTIDARAFRSLFGYRARAHMNARYLAAAGKPNHTMVGAGKPNGCCKRSPPDNPCFSLANLMLPTASVYRRTLGDTFRPITRGERPVGRKKPVCWCASTQTVCVVPTMYQLPVVCVTTM
jgi:hypothetical protein